MPKQLPWNEMFGKTYYVAIIVLLLLPLIRTHAGQHSASLSVEITSKNNVSEAKNEALFKLMRKNFRDKIVLGTGYDLNDTEVKKRIRNITSNARTYWNNMEKIPVTYLWSGYNGLKNNPATAPKHVYSSYDRLLIMAQAYAYES